MESKSNRLLNLATKKQIIRAKDVFALGIPRNYLPRLVRKVFSERSDAAFMLRTHSPLLSICR